MLIKSRLITYDFEAYERDYKEWQQENIEAEKMGLQVKEEVKIQDYESDSVGYFNLTYVVSWFETSDGFISIQFINGDSNAYKIDPKNFKDIYDNYFEVETTEL